MAYERIQGTIEAIARTRKSIQLDDGEWYSAFAAAQVGDVQVGDLVEFDMQAKEDGDKTFLNIKGNVEFVGEGEAPAAPARSAGRAGGSRGAPARTAPARTPARAAAPARGGSRGNTAAPARTGGGGHSQTQTSIIRQNSLTQANALISHSDALKADLQELGPVEAAGFVIDIAKVFEEYSSANDA